LITFSYQKVHSKGSVNEKLRSGDKGNEERQRSGHDTHMILKGGGNA